jgi:hypothetical protein
LQNLVGLAKLMVLSLERTHYLGGIARQARSSVLATSTLFIHSRNGAGEQPFSPTQREMLKS